MLFIFFVIFITHPHTHTKITWDERNNFIKWKNEAHQKREKKSKKQINSTANKPTLENFMRFEFFNERKTKKANRKEKRRDICVFRERMNVRTSSYRMNMDLPHCFSSATSFVHTFAVVCCCCRRYCSRSCYWMNYENVCNTLYSWRMTHFLPMPASVRHGFTVRRCCFGCCCWCVF